MGYTTYRSQPRAERVFKRFEHVQVIFVLGLEWRQNKIGLRPLGGAQDTSLLPSRAHFHGSLWSQKDHDLFVAQGDDRVDLCGAAGGDVASQDSGGRQNQRDAAEDERIVGADPEEQAGKDAHGCESNKQAQR
jgi:hypothetical protein